MIIKISKLLLFASILLGCRNQTGDFIPNVLVDITLNLNNPSYQPVNLVGGYMLLPNDAYRGIFLYRFSLNEFKAYDLACTHQPSQSCHVVRIDTATTLLQCGCCSSRFNFEGQVLQGPAALPLKAYRTLYQPATNTLQITN